MTIPLSIPLYVSRWEVLMWLFRVVLALRENSSLVWLCLTLIRSENAMSEGSRPCWLLYKFSCVAVFQIVLRLLCTLVCEVGWAVYDHYLWWWFSKCAWIQGQALLCDFVKYLLLSDKNKHCARKFVLSYADALNFHLSLLEV